MANKNKKAKIDIDIRLRVQASVLDHTHCTRHHDRLAAFVVRFASQHSLYCCDQCFKMIRRDIESNGERVIILHDTHLRAVSLPSHDITPYLSSDSDSGKAARKAGRQADKDRYTARVQSILFETDVL